MTLAFENDLSEDGRSADMEQTSMRQAQETQVYIPRGELLPSDSNERDSPVGEGPQRSVNVSSPERLASSIIGVLLMGRALKHRAPANLAAALLGGGLIYRGLTGHCHLYHAIGINRGQDASETVPAEHAHAHDVQRTITIDMPAADLHRFWSQPDNLRRIMSPFAQVDTAADGTTRWRMRTPFSGLFEWNTLVVEDQLGERLRWRTVRGFTPISEGSLRFAPAPGNRGTRVMLSLTFARLGPASAAATRALKVVPSMMASSALRRFKSLVETGEIATTIGSPSARDTEGSDAAALSPIARALGWFSVGLGITELVAPQPLARATGVPPSPRLLRVLGLRELASGIGILSGRRRSGWLWSRVAGDLMDLGLLVTALASASSRRGRVAAVTGAVMGITVIDLLTSWKQTRTDLLTHRRPSDEGTLG